MTLKKRAFWHLLIANTTVLIYFSIVVLLTVKGIQSHVLGGMVLSLALLLPAIFAVTWARPLVVDWYSEKLKDCRFETEWDL